MKPTFDPTYGGNFDTNFTATIKAWNYTTSPYASRDNIIIGTFGAGGGVAVNNPDLLQRPALLEIKSFIRLSLQGLRYTMIGRGITYLYEYFSIILWYPFS